MGRILAQITTRGTPHRLLLTLAISIFTAEVVVMVILPFLPLLSTWLEAILDGSIMIILISPPLYFLGFRPLIRQVIERRRAEEDLRRSRDEMELRVKERTADLQRANEVLTEEISMRRRVEKELVETHRKLDATLANMADGFVAHDRDWRFTYVNPAALRLFGKTREELLGKVCWEAFPEQVGTAAYTAYHRAVEQNALVQFEQFHEPGKIWYEGRCHPTDDGLVVFFNDITERKRTESRLHLLSSALESAANGIAIADPRGCIEWVNPAFTELTGYSRDEAVGQNPRILKSGHHPDSFYRDMWSTISRGDSWTGEVVNRRKDGRLYTERMTIAPVRGGGGSITHFVAIKEDITARKEAERQIEHLASFPRLNPSPVLEVDADGNVKFVNAAALRVVQEMGVDDARVFLPADMGVLLASAGENAETVSREVEVGGRSFLETIYISGEFRGVRIYAVDITRRRQVEVELRESREDLSRAQAVAHAGSWRLYVPRDVLLWSDETYRIFGIPKGTPLTYELFLGAVHPDDRARVDERWQAAMRGDSYDIEHRIVVDGGVKWVRERAELEVDPDGSLRGGFGTVQDITELKRAEEVLHRSLEEYRSLMEEASDGILLFENDTVIAANTRLCAMLGYSKDEVASCNVHDFLPPESPGLIPAPPERGEDSEAAVIVEHQLRRKDGTLIEVETTAIRLANGRSQAIIRDVTEKRLREQRARRLIKEDVFEKLLLRLRAFKHGQSGAMNLNRIALFAENLQHIFGKEGAIRDTGPDWKGQASPGFQDLLGRFETVVEEFQTLVSPELHRIASLVMLAEVDAGAPNASDHFRVAAEALLALTEHLTGRIGSVATFLRTSDPDTSGHLYRDLQEDILGTVMKIRYAVADVSTFVEANFTTSVADAVATCVAKFASRSADVHVTSVNWAEESRAVFCTSELCEVLSILIENSLEAFDKQAENRPDSGKAVSVIAEKSGDCVRIIVEDNGPGIPPELRERIFEEPVSDKSPDRGFGLSYARKCVTKFGGRIRYEPSARAGARFVIELVKI